MRPQAMHLDGLPPLHVPFRFYLTAPLFGIAAALLLLLEPQAWLSRWTGATLAAVHLLALGVISMVMLGSLFQVVPVLGGRAVARAQTIAPWVHVSLTLGTALLSASLLRPDWQLWGPALVLLGIGFGVFLVAVGVPLARRASGGDSVFVIRLAVMALAVTVGLGVFLALCRGWPGIHGGFREWTDLHAAWGIAGFVALLVMGVSFQVIPMFQVAPAFRSSMARGSAITLFLALAAISHARSGWVMVSLMTLISASLVTYAIHALSVLARRRRRRVDALNWFWKLSLASLIATAVLAWLLTATPLRSTGFGPRAELLLGVLAILGFVLSVIFGMLMKIASFLAFLHLQRRCLTDVTVAGLLPTMADFVSENASRRQFYLHALTVAAALAAASWPLVGGVAAVLLAADFGLLMRNLSVAAGRYRRASAEIETALGG